ncbi:MULTISPECIES: hypothetical protein [Enterococcus]|uniref:Uncharacterized protein n=1 Tax=Enterococcus mundtii TaxID=53346 RepID=A0A1V2UHU4_ENTMU|nr:hypothetical protein [Enterococcus mundtii]EOH61328.1 hypothetical protein UAC_01893 [Enterococcus mundtii ATCC 882]EOU12399.1 hypothetical protein I587_00945 [Enterococcus mundtii ATCC 882]MBE9910739.1 hypothetical protein [Enterococcus mundtii]MRI74472.1 hypothetical protein [Enterococcus mundtii]NMP57293.1 hypothetical protein [Enterococcus mundtii]
MAHSNNIEKKNHSKKKRTYILFSLLLVCLVAGIGGYFYFNQSPPQVVAGLPDLDDHLSRLSNEDILKAMQDQVDKDKMRILLKHDIEVDKEGKASVDVRNNGQNAFNIQVEYYLASNNKQLYKSGLIPPNNRIDSIPFENLPDAGSHDVRILYNIYNEEKLVNTTTIDGKINIS